MEYECHENEKATDPIDNAIGTSSRLHGIGQTTDEGFRSGCACTMILGEFNAVPVAPGGPRSAISRPPQNRINEIALHSRLTNTCKPGDKVIDRPHFTMHAFSESFPHLRLDESHFGSEIQGRPAQVPTFRGLMIFTNSSNACIHTTDRDRPKGGGCAANNWRFWLVWILMVHFLNR